MGVSIQHLWLSASLLLLLLLYYPDAVFLWDFWLGSEEYNHGPLMLLVALVFAWKRKGILRAPQDSLKWVGLIIVVLAVVAYALAIKANIENLRQFAFLAIVGGAFLAAGGKNYWRYIAPSLILLLFVIPLPHFFVADLSYKLQLLSSDASVTLLRLSGVSVFQDGNIIDLGTTKLEVAEACSGLRYLFPMIGIGILGALSFDIGLTKRLLIVALAAAVSVVMNIVRIYITGLLVNNAGLEVSEGFFHLLEGWVYFLVSLFVLAGLASLVLNRFERSTIGYGAFSIRSLPPSTAPTSSNAPITLVALLLVIALALFHSLRTMEPVIPERTDFAGFPLKIENWTAEPLILPKIEQGVLQMSDYFLGIYRSPGQPEITLLISYYASQSAGRSPHSPRVCIPTGGWSIENLNRISVQHNTSEIPVNRAIVEKGEQRQLVYYWFQQKGRSIANEYFARLNLLHNGLLHSRTDGALVRLTTSMGSTAVSHDADIRLREFSRLLVDVLPPFLPN